MKSFLSFFVMFVFVFTFCFCSTSNAYYREVTQEVADGVLNDLLTNSFSLEFASNQVDAVLIDQNQNTPGYWHSQGIHLLEQPTYLINIGCYIQNPSHLVIVFLKETTSTMNDFALTGIVGHYLAMGHDFNRSYASYPYIDTEVFGGFSAQKKVYDEYLLSKLRHIELYEFNLWVEEVMPPVNGVPQWSGVLKDTIEESFNNMYNLWIQQGGNIPDEAQVIYNYFNN